MICNDCGHAVSMNKMCETPIQSATDILKHVAAHSASRAFAAVECVSQAKLEDVSIISLPAAVVVGGFEPPVQ